MFYEEKLVNGCLMSRTSPDGDWVPVTVQRVASLYVELLGLRKEMAKQVYDDR